MDINMTLIGQIITFAMFVLFTMKVVWPPIIKALAERQKKIAGGLADAERGRHELQLAQRKVVDMLSEAKAHAAELLKQASEQGNHIIDEAKAAAREESKRLVILATADIEQLKQAAKQELRQQIADVVIASAEKLLQRSIDTAANTELLSKLIEEI